MSSAFQPALRSRTCTPGCAGTSRPRTITTYFQNFGAGRFGHPEQDRTISLREAAILQGFPDDYLFAPDGEVAPLTTLGRHIGNAVPPPLGEAIGRNLMASLEEGGPHG